MLKFIFLTLVLIPCFLVSDAQVIVASYIHLPADSNQSKQLITSLNGFLNLATKPNNENTFVLKEDLPETSALLDEIKGMSDGTQPGMKDFYKCYLTNIMPLDSVSDIVQFSYIGIQGAAPVLRASFNIIAKRHTINIVFAHL